MTVRFDIERGDNKWEWVIFRDGERLERRELTVTHSLAGPSTVTLEDTRFAVGFRPVTEYIDVDVYLCGVLRCSLRPATGVLIDGPYFKGHDEYLSHDGDNPEAPWPGYGWPLGTECWYFRMTGPMHRLWATGLTVKSAWKRTIALHRVVADEPMPLLDEGFG